MTSRQCDLDCESIAQFGLPLLAKSCRCDDEEMRVGPPLEKLADDETRLHGLPEANLVGDEHT